MRNATLKKAVKYLNHVDIYEAFQHQSQKTTALQTHYLRKMGQSKGPMGSAVRKFVYEKGTFQFSESSIYVISLRTFIQMNVIQQFLS